MNRTWKWILIGLGVFFLAFCVALPLFVGSFRMIGYGGMPMMGNQPYGRFPMMEHGFGIFGGFGLFRFLFPLFGLAVLVAVIVGIVLLLRRPQRPAAAVAAPAVSVGPAAPLDAAPAEPAAPAAVAAEATVVETTPCPHCGGPVQAGWVACPHCGEKLV